MNLILLGVMVLCILIPGWILIRRLRAKREVQAKSIEPEALYALLNAKQVLLYDVRQPLDFLLTRRLFPEP